MICTKKDFTLINIYASNIEVGFPSGSAGKESISNVGDVGLIPGSERYPGEGNGSQLQDSCLENSPGSYNPWGRKELFLSKTIGNAHTHPSPLTL